MVLEVAWENSEDYTEPRPLPSEGTSLRLTLRRFALGPQVLLLGISWIQGTDASRAC